MPETWVTTELAAEFGVATRTVRFYGDKDLLPRSNAANAGSIISVIKCVLS